MITYVAALSYVSNLNYMLCYFVTTATLHAVSIAGRIYELHWYQMPRTSQIYVHLMIKRAQKPLELKGLGVFVCSLETFLTVIKSQFKLALAYILTFRAFFRWSEPQCLIIWFFENCKVNLDKKPSYFACIWLLKAINSRRIK